MKTLYKVLFGIACFFVVGFSVVWIAQSPKSCPRPLVVGMMSGWAPFMVINDRAKFEGFDVDVAQDLATRLGQPLEIQDIGSLASLLLALEQGKIDLALSGLDITESRRQKLRMIPYTGQAITYFCLLFKDKIPAGVTTIQDLQRLNTPTICVEPGSSQEKYLDQFPWISAKSLGKIEDMVLDVSYDKSLAMLVEPQVAARLMRQVQQLASLVVPIEREFQTFGMGITLMPTQKNLAQKIETFVNQMRTDGTLARLEKKWNLTSQVQS